MTDDNKRAKDGVPSHGPSDRNSSPRHTSGPDRRDKRAEPGARREGGRDAGRRDEGGGRPGRDSGGRPERRDFGDKREFGRDKEGGEPRRDRPFRREDDSRRDRPFRRDDAPRGGGAPHRDGPDGPGEQRPRGATGALIELDRDLMKLLVRRAVLVSRIRDGRDHASSPDAIQAEKAVRMAWETGALAFSKDPRFTRQLFTLLQDLKVLTKEQSEHSGSYSLSPPAKPVSGELTGPADTRTAQMYTALAACRGDSLTLNAVLLSEALMDTVKACSQVGAAVSHQNQGTSLGGISVDRGDAVSFAGKMIFLGEDFFTLCLMAFLSIGKPGTCRLTGGARLKGADLSSLRQVLPLFGARLAHVVPRSQGLPATLESSGQIPPHVVLPADLPLEAVCALLLAPLAWNVPIAFNLAALPASVATAALAEVGPVHLACGADVENRGSQLAYTPGPLNIPARPDLPLDPALSAYLLALPAFAGGSLTLKGRWFTHLPESREAEQLLSWAGLSLKCLDEAITVEADQAPFAMPLQCNDLTPELGPLFLVLAARQQALAGGAPTLPCPTPFPADEMENVLAQDFFERIGFNYADGQVTLSEQNGQSEAPAFSAWTSPDAHWGMAFALAAFLRSGLRLANPGNVTEVMPPFWSIYNSLPKPADPARTPKEKPQEPKDDKPARRRIIAD